MATLRTRAWALLVPLVLAAAAYARAVRGGFVFDDWFTIVRNPGIRDLRAALARWPTWLDGGRPLTDLTFALDYAAGGLDPLGYHLVNVVLHLGVATLVFVFTRRVLRLAGAPAGHGVALATAGLFAVHPLQAQAVSYVSQRSEVLASGLYLACLLLLFRAEEERRGTLRAAAWAGGFASFVVALAAKPIALTAPAAYLLLGAAAPVAAGERGRWLRRIAYSAPLFAVVALVALRTLRAVEGRPDVGFAVPAAERGSYFLTQWRAVALYLRLLAWPSGQRVEWDLEVSRGLGDPAVVGAGLLLAALSGAAVAALAWGRRREGEAAALARVAGVGVLWFFLVLSVTSSVVPLADLVMEHRPYLASWGVLAAACATCRATLARPGAPLAGRAGAALVGIVWGGLALALFLRNAAWESDLALWGDAVEKSPRSARARVNLGHALRRAGDAASAIRTYETALALAPAGDRALRVAALRNLGAARLATGETRRAVDTLREALVMDPANAEVLTNLAVGLHRQHDTAGAEAAALSALRADRNQAEALTVLGAIHMERDDAPGALPFLAAAVDVEPEVARHHVNVGMAYDRLGRTTEACAAWSRALALGLAGPARASLLERARARSCR